MFQPLLRFKRLTRLIGNRLKQHSPAVILTAIATVILLDTVGYNVGVPKNVSNRDDTLKYEENSNSQIAYEHALKKRNNRPSLQQIKTFNKDSPSNAEMLVRIKTKYPTDGYDRALFLKEICSKLNDKRENNLVRVSYNAEHAALFCPLCKVASTFWTRVFQMIARNRNQKLIKHPFEIPISEAPESKQFFRTFDQWIDNELSGDLINAKDSFRFLFVRNPFSLLFSAFVDKIVGPNPLFWKIFKSVSSPKARKDQCGANLSFEQFLRNIVQGYITKHTLNCHVATFDACQPCVMNYTFVAKMETFKEDTFHILARLNQTQTLQIFDENFSSLHADDAIEDSTSGPFLWRSEITRCISWGKALQRIWRKLQIRGIIGRHGFPLSEEEAKKITQNQFIELLRKSRSESTSKERGWLKKQALKEAYISIPVDILNEIRKIYKNELLLFNYKDLLDETFDDNSNFRNYGLFNYNNIHGKIAHE